MESRLRDIRQKYLNVETKASESSLVTQSRGLSQKAKAESESFYRTVSGASRDSQTHTFSAVAGSLKDESGRILDLVNSDKYQAAAEAHKKLAAEYLKFSGNNYPEKMRNAAKKTARSHQAAAESLSKI